MIGLVYILKTILYYVFLIITYVVSSHYNKKNKKLSFAIIIFLSLMISTYSFVSTAHPYVMDKRVYAIKFSHDIYLPQVRGESEGLYMLETNMHRFTYNPDILFFVVAFIYTFITLLAYKKSKRAKPFALMLLLLSEYMFFGFYQLKQCMAIALVTLGMVEHENGKKLIAYLLILLAIIFHEAALITIPLLIMLRGSDKKYIRYLEYIGFILIVLFFYPITSFILKFIIKLVPFLAYQLTIYINESGNFITDLNFLTALKGLPFYVITIVGFVKRKELKDKIPNYDRYLTITFFISITIILSIYMYWFFRFGTFYYLFAFILAQELFENIKVPKQKLLFLILTAGALLGLGIKLWLQYYFIYGGI